MTDTVNIIAYGTLMQRERNHYFCRNAIRITPCTLKGTLYDTGYSFPALTLTGDTTIHAELIEIPDSDWPAIDRLEGYPQLYDRVFTEVSTADGPEQGWVYIMQNLPADAKVIPSGTWRKQKNG